MSSQGPNTTFCPSGPLKKVPCSLCSVPKCWMDSESWCWLVCMKLLIADSPLPVCLGLVILKYRLDPPNQEERVLMKKCCISLVNANSDNLVTKNVLISPGRMMHFYGLLLEEKYHSVLGLSLILSPCPSPYYSWLNGSLNSFFLSSS